MIFNYDANKTHFHNKGFALSLVLKVRFFGTRKWPIKLTQFPGGFCLNMFMQGLIFPFYSSVIAASF